VAIHTVVRQGYVLQQNGAEADGARLGNPFVSAADSKIAVTNGKSYAVGA
jgi:hypothetical protein